GAGGSRRHAKGRNRRLRRHPYERHSVLPLPDIVGRTRAALGRQPDPARRRRVSRAGPRGRHQDRNRHISARQGERRARRSARRGAARRCRVATADRLKRYSGYIYLPTMNVHQWLLLTYKVPPEPASKRVALWRRLKSMGAVYLQNGVCLLPKTDDHGRRLKMLENEIGEMGGEAVILGTGPPAPAREEKA